MWDDWDQTAHPGSKAGSRQIENAVITTQEEVPCGPKIDDSLIPIVSDLVGWQFSRLGVASEGAAR